MYKESPPTVEGWKPPIVYDIATDKHRVVTQEDVDKWVETDKIYSRMINYLELARREHLALVSFIEGMGR